MIYKHKIHHSKLLKNGEGEHLNENGEENGVCLANEGGDKNAKHITHTLKLK
jgi:hypothetical protein